MSFRIHSASPELKRELERKLAEVESQLEEGFEYEISAEILPREQALDRVDKLADEIGAQSVFVAEGVFAVEPVEDEDPDFAIGLPPVADEQRRAENGPSTQEPGVTEARPVQEIRTPRIDTQKFKDAAKATASQTRATLQRAGRQSGAALKVAGEHTAHFMGGAGRWASQNASSAKVAVGEMLARLGAKSEQWKASRAERNAERQERRRIESEAREKRQRAAHREAELAAISAQVMLERQRQEEKAHLAAEIPQRKLEPTPSVRPAAGKVTREERDMWPVWRNAFVASACITLVGVFLLATGSKQTSAAPSTSTELSQPAVVVPSHSVERPKPQTTPPAVGQVPRQITAAKPAPKHVVSSEDEDDVFQEVTVRHYPNASPLAPPKKNSQGVVQISDME